MITQFNVISIQDEATVFIGTDLVFSGLDGRKEILSATNMIETIGKALGLLWRLKLTYISDDDLRREGIDPVGWGWDDIECLLRDGYLSRDKPSFT